MGPKSRGSGSSGRAVALLGMLAIVALAAWIGRLQLAQDDPLTAAAEAYKKSDWAHAADLARARLKTAQSDEKALLMLARASGRLGRDDAAISIYDRLGTARMEAEDLFLLGLILGRQGNNEMALNVWAKAAAESSPQPELLLGLANLYARGQRLDEAEATARKLAEVPGWEACGLLVLGTTKVSLEDDLAAVDALRRGLELDAEARQAPLAASVYRKLLAGCLLRLGRPDEAARWLEPLLSDSPDAKPDEEACWLASRAALQQEKLASAATLLARSGSYRANHPLVPEPSPHVGSARCVSCHREQSQACENTRHSRTFHHGDALLKLPRPDGTMTDPDHPEVTHTIVQQGKKLKALTRVEDRVFEVLIDYAYGTSDRYVTMVGRDGEGNFRALRRSFFHTGRESGWGRTSGDLGGPDTQSAVRGQTISVRDGVVRCLHCHTTNPRAYRDPDHDAPGPEAADRGIGCERCHGPGKNHLIAVEKDLPDRAIVSVGVGSAEGNAVQCRSCHIVGNASEMEHSREDPIWVRSPGATMTFSRCYTESAGRMGCLSCHDPHRDSDRSATFYEKKCLECHSAPTTASPKGRESSPIDMPSTAGAVSICPVNPKEGCISCHMPKVRMPVLHTSLTDHYIRIHKNEAQATPGGKSP